MTTAFVSARTRGTRCPCGRCGVASDLSEIVVTGRASGGIRRIQSTTNKESEDDDQAYYCRSARTCTGLEEQDLCRCAGAGQALAHRADERLAGAALRPHGP